LIILQYGGNVLPVINSEKNVKGYMKQLANSIKTLRSFCLNAQFIFIGPADMTKTYKGKKQTDKHLELLVRELKVMCKEQNLIFFDMYAAMHPPWHDDARFCFTLASPKLERHSEKLGD
jgi:archaellum biogenesis ATPase FlaH